MRNAVMILALAAFVPAARGADYIKDGKLTETLVVKDVQGGFAGFTGKQWSVAPDGKWEESSVFGKKTKSLRTGSLTKKKLEDLAAELKKYDVATLKNEGKPMGANPRVVSVAWGKTTASLTLKTGAALPAKGTKDMAGRIAGVVSALEAALKK